MRRSETTEKVIIFSLTPRGLNNIETIRVEYIFTRLYNEFVSCLWSYSKAEGKKETSFIKVPLKIYKI